MSIEITIIGLGQIGTSIGLALGAQEGAMIRTGHDRDRGQSGRAEKLGAVDKTSRNLGRSVRKADVVVLALPLDQIEQTLADIAKDLKANAVVMDTAPIKRQVIEWAAQTLPAERHYVGLLPVLSPAYLHETARGLDAARADLFQGGLIGVITPPGTESGAIKLAVDFTTLIGSTPLFMDALESDSLMAATHVLPHLVAAALLDATVDQPGWLEARKLAGRGYAQVTSPMDVLDAPAALGSALALNHQNVARVLDNMIANLEQLRVAVLEQDQAALLKRLARARERRDRWWEERVLAEWASPPPSESQGLPRTGFIEQLIFGRRPPEQKR
jgi:prephenate dehydrogenase